MEINTIKASDLSKMFLAGSKYLEANKDLINELNVFPVPDGDTGTNMTMTIMSAAKEVAALENPEMAPLCKAISSGSLRGARGNSGVILSQLFRGFTKICKTHDELTVEILAEACQKSVETAYKAVMKPKEGTILTVAKAAADKATEMADKTDNILEFYEAVVIAAEETLEQTPEMLPVLKQAGVVDSGGRGLLEVLKGGYDLLSGKDIDLSVDGAEKKEDKEEVEMPKYLYRMSFVIKSTTPINSKDVIDYKVYLEALGEQISVEQKDQYVSVIIMTNEPGRVISKATKLGTMSQVSMVNIVDDEVSKDDQKIIEMPKKEEEVLPEKEMGFVTVAAGDGLVQIFKDLGADYVISGGQTMNPSTDDILSAVEKVNAKTVFVLPNNKNIILAANQAEELCKDKKVIVIPTKTLPQGITALINFVPDQSVKDNQDRMTEELQNVKSGEVTYAVRDTTIDDKEIKEGDYMGIGDAGILAVKQDLTEVMLQMLDEMVDDDSALISLYYGADVKKKDANKMKKAVEEKYTSLDVELQEGGQPVYYYVTSVE
ncbi:MAG: DAK2 domain-containing protein [Lachnospiraceae bacterium]|nr:DAK2 domain-containing protein [Lachnospiraceae bacterium]